VKEACYVAGFLGEPGAGPFAGYVALDKRGHSPSTNATFRSHCMFVYHIVKYQPAAMSEGKIER